MDRFLEVLRAEYPDYPLSVRKYSCPDDPTIECFIDILLVPTDRLHDVAWQAWGLAEEVYGDEPTRFLMTTVDPESSAEHFAEELDRASDARPLEETTAAFPVMTVAQRSTVPQRWDVGDFLTMCAGLAAAYWVNLELSNIGGALPPDNQRSLAPDCGLAEDGSTVRPQDPLEADYPIAA